MPVHWLLSEASLIYIIVSNIHKYLYIYHTIHEDISLEHEFNFNINIILGNIFVRYDFFIVRNWNALGWKHPLVTNIRNQGIYKRTTQVIEQIFSCQYKKGKRICKKLKKIWFMSPKHDWQTDRKIALKNQCLD